MKALYAAEHPVGNPPLGYDIQYRQLVPNKSEAKTVNYIFERYLALSNVIRLKQELDRDGIVSKVLTYKDGRTVGGKPFSRGALYALLSNPIYIGQIRHKNKTYDGQHDGIISIDLWTTVQQKLHQQASIYKGQKISREVNLLKGLLFDAQGVPYTPGYTVKGKKHYRYYISQNLIQMRDHPDELLGRLPAHEIESAVEGAIRAHLSDREKISSLLGIDLNDEAEAIQKIADIQAAVSIDQFLRACIEQIIVQADKLEIKIRIDDLSSFLSNTAKVKINSTVDIRILLVPYTIRRAKKGALVIAPEKQQKDVFDLPLNELKKLVQGFIWRDEHFSGMTLRDIAKREEFSEGYVGQCIFQTFEIPLA